MTDKPHTEIETERIEKGFKEKFGQDDGFIVPEGYFNAFKDSLNAKLERINEQYNRQTRVLKLFTSFSVAASLALIVSLWVFDQNASHSGITELSEPVLDEYYFDEGDIELIAETNDLTSPPEVTIELNEVELAEYFDEENVEIEALLEDI